MLLSLAFPMWKIVLEAVQMPTRAMVIRLYVYPRIGGDYELAASLNKYSGFHYPDPVLVTPNFEVSDAALAVPEWTLAPLLFVALGLGAIAVAFASDDAIGTWLKRYFVGAVGAMAVAAVWFQFRLYQAGHNLDPNAPMTGIDGFTVPMLGPYTVANIDGVAWLDVGGYLLVAGFALLFVAHLARDTDAPISDLPSLAGAGLGRIRATVTGR